MQRAELSVAEDGTILVPFSLNRILSVEGQTASQLKTLLDRELRRFYREPVVQVVIKEYRAQLACLLGEIRSGERDSTGPGCYPLRGEVRLLEFVTRHGGVTPEADITQVKLNRGGESFTLDLAQVIFGGSQEANLPLQAGDIIWVLSRDHTQRVHYVFGEVRKPGLVKSSETLRLAEAVARAGSFSPDAALDRTAIIRGDTSRAQIFRLDLRRFLEQGDASQNPVLEDSDVVYVPRRSGARFRDWVKIVLPVLGVLRDTAILYEVLRDE